ncbi:DUF3519 domain-containing protein, partial [Campylobacter upsaliensis]
MQDSAKSADEVLNSLIKYAKGQGEKGVNNLQKIKDYLGEENNAFLEMQILNKLFKESVVENDRAGVRVFDSESFLGRVRELVGENELYAKNELDGLSSGKLKEILQSWDLSKENNANKKLRQIVSKLENDEAKELSKHFNFKGKKPLVREIDSHQILHALNRHGDEETELKRGQKALTLEDISEYENIVKNYDFKHIQDNGRIIYAKQVNGHHIVLEEVLSGQDKLRFFDMWKQKGQLNKEVLLSHSQRPNANLDQMTKRRMPSSDESITQPLFKSKEAREFLELVEGFHKLYKNDASIAKNLVQGTSEKLSTSIATSAEGAIKQKVVKGGFDPIFRLLPDKILFGLFSKQIQGGALRYHLKKALSRSLNYDDFKIKLEKELKRTNFNSNTSRLIDEFMQNLEDFNREKEQFLEAKRIEQARIKEEERKRAEEIYKRQEANNLKDILEAEEKPLKDEFGVNFEGFKGKEAIEKLLEEQRGQVKGAFYKEGLGEIDLVWGEVKGGGKEAKGYGLSKIIEKHGEDFKEFGEGLEGVSKGLDEIITKGEIHTQEYGRKTIIYHKNGDVYKVGLKQNWKGEPTKNSWVITGYKEDREADKFIHSSDFTKGEALPLNSKESIAQKAKNDEVLEAEVIEEVGLNEPMKFLEFQQRKLLTYIKENTPLRLLEHKKELKTRDILNFLEQSALNGKQKVFLMRNLERDFTKLKEDFKELESQSFKRDLLDKTKPLRKAEKEELTSEVLEQVQKENLKLYLNDTSGNLTKFLNAKKPFKITMRGANIKHILNRHGENSTLAKNGQPFVNLEDIKKYDEIINNADRQILKENDKGEKTLLSGKQINGHYIVISSVRLKNGELKLKTMYKENGKLENDKAFKSVKLPSETPSVLRGQSLTTDLDGYPSHA